MPVNIEIELKGAKHAFHTFAKLEEVEARRQEAFAKVNKAYKKQQATLKALKAEIKQLKEAVELGFDKTAIVNFNKELEVMSKKMNAVNKKGVKPAGVKKAKSGLLDLGKIGSKLKGVMAGAFAVEKIMSFGNEIIKTTAQFQKYDAVLTNTLGSASEAKKVMGDITNFAATTPFQVDKITDSYVKLASAGFQPTNQELRNLGDLAASKGKEFDQLAEAVIDAETGEFERLKEFGIKAAQAGDQVSFSFNGVTKTVGKNSEEIRKYLLGLGEVEGVKGSMEAISNTLGGQISNLEDGFTQLKLAIGEELAPVFAEVIGALSQGMSFVKDNIGNVIGFFGKYKKAFQLIWDLSGIGMLINLIKYLYKKFNEGGENATKLKKVLKTMWEYSALNMFLRLLNGLGAAFESIKANIDKLVNSKNILAFFKNLKQVSKDAGKAFVKSFKEDHLAKRKKKAVKEEPLKKKKAKPKAKKTATASQKKAYAEQLKARQKMMEEQARRRSAFNLREIKAKQELEAKILQADINSLKEQLKNKDLNAQQKIDLLKQLEQAEGKAIEANQKKALTVYQVDKNNQIRIKTLTKSEKEKIDFEYQQKRIKIEEATQKKIAEINAKDSAQKAEGVYKAQLSELEAKLNKKLSGLNGQSKGTNTAAQFAAVEKKRTDVVKNAEQERLELHKSYLEEQLNSEYLKVEQRKKIKDELIAIEREEIEKKHELDKEASEKKIELLKQEEEQKKLLKQETKEQLTGLANALYDDNAMKITNELNTLKIAKDKELQLAGENKEAKARIEDKFATKERQIKRKQSENEKKKAMFNIGIQTAQGIAKAIGQFGFPWAIPFIALALVQGNLQRRKVESQTTPSFFDGTEYVGLGGNPKGRDTIPAMLHEGERVVPTAINTKLKGIKNFELPGLVDLGFKLKNNLLPMPVVQKTDNQLAKGITKAIKEAPFSQITIDDEGFKKYIVEGNSQTEILNKDYNW